MCVSYSELAPLNYIDVKINGVQRTISALDDDGTEITVLRSDLLNKSDVDYVPIGTISLRGVLFLPVT